jgi:hypothetical protein
VKKLAITLATLLLPVVSISSARASTIQTAGGAFDSTVGVTRVEHSGGNTILYGPEVQHLTGALDGIRVATGVMIVHADGSFEARDEGVFTGTVDGRSGTVEIDGVSKGIGNSGTGRLVFRHGTDSLSGLHGEGVFAPTFTSPTTATGTYSAALHFQS